jgi:hypothetical protein
MRLPSTRLREVTSNFRWRSIGPRQDQHITAEGRIGFRSYLFLVRETAGELKVNDPDEQISGWDERDIEGLRAASAQLRTLGGTWQRWGQFRALALDVLVNALA